MATRGRKYNDYKVSAKVTKIKPLMQAFRSINLDENCIFEISSEGIKVTVEHSKFVQANLYISTKCFEEFNVRDDGVVMFGVNLNIVAECLATFSGQDCVMEFLYKGKGSPLVFLMKHCGDFEFCTECSIKTKHYEELSEYELSDDSTQHNVVIFNGPFFYEIFLELDKTAEEIEINISPTEPYFQITTIGVMLSESDFAIAKSSDMIIKFQSKQATKFRYKYSHMKMVQKALSLSSKVALRTDTSGLLDIHFMLKSTADDVEMYIQYFVTPLVQT